MRTYIHNPMQLLRNLPGVTLKRVLQAFFFAFVFIS